MDIWGTTAIAWLVSLLGATSGGPACVELAALDLQRSVAYSEASPDDLADLFVDDSAAASDLATLGRWHDRGHTLDSAMLVIGSCTVVQENADEVWLSVVDRLAPTVAVMPDGTRTPLPHDDWSQREIVLRQVKGVWKYAGGG